MTEMEEEEVDKGDKTGRVTEQAVETGAMLESDLVFLVANITTGEDIKEDVEEEELRMLTLRKMLEWLSDVDESLAE